MAERMLVHGYAASFWQVFPNILLTEHMYAKEEKGRDVFHLGFTLPSDTHANSGEIDRIVSSAECCKGVSTAHIFCKHIHWEAPSIDIYVDKDKIWFIKFRKRGGYASFQHWFQSPFKTREARGRQWPSVEASDLRSPRASTIPENQREAFSKVSLRTDLGHHCPFFPAPKPRQTSRPQQLDCQSKGAASLELGPVFWKLKAIKL